MAIFHCDVSIIGRSAGRSATGAAAYRAGEKLLDERTGMAHDYTRRDGIAHTEILAPANAPAWTQDRAQLWNAVEAAEKRKDAQLAREIVVALPHELSAEQRLDLLRGYIREQFTAKGMIADLAIHAPSKNGDERNHHAHILLTMRKPDGDGFGNKVRRWNAKAHVYRWREAWEQHANRALEQAGLADRIDGRSLAAKGLDQEPHQHLGPHASALERRGEASDRGDGNRAIAARNATRAQMRRELDEVNGEIDKLLNEVSRTRAVFDERDLARTLFKHDIDPDARYKILADAQVIRLEGENGQTLFTTQAVRGEEQAALDAARRIHGQRDHDRSSMAALDKTLRRYEGAGRPLDAEQESALRHALDNRLAIIQGRAGTGKSFTLNALRETLESQGYAVTGLAPTNTAAKDLREAGFGDARTAHSFLYSHRKACEAGRLEPPASRAPRVLIVDEAAMIDTRRTKELLLAAEQLDARVVFAGDERQLASVEAGGLFGVFAQEFGAAELSHVYRQREDWQREATRAFARGETAMGLQAYADHDAIQWSDKREDAAAQLVKQWVAERDNGSAKSAFVFANSNAAVDGLNAALQVEQVKKGLVKDTKLFTTERGKLWVGEGDRLQFRANDKPNGVYNGSLGTVEGIEGDIIAVRLDTGGTYRIDTQVYRDFQLGYAGTVYRGQGKTIDSAFVLYSPGMDKKAAYVAMTRARDHTHVFVAREDAHDLKGMVGNIESRKQYGASLNYAVKPHNPPLPEAKQPEEVARLERARLRTEYLRQQQRDRERERKLGRRLGR